MYFRYKRLTIIIQLHKITKNERIVKFKYNNNKLKLELLFRRKIRYEFIT